MEIKASEWIRLSGVEKLSGVQQATAYRIAHRLGLVAEILGVYAIRRSDVAAVAAAVTPRRGYWWRRNIAAKSTVPPAEEADDLPIETDDWVGIDEAAAAAGVAANTARRIAGRLGIARRVLGVTAIRKADIPAIARQRSAAGDIWKQNPDIATQAARRGAAASLKARGLRRTRTARRAGRDTSGTAAADRREE